MNTFLHASSLLRVLPALAVIVASAALLGALARRLGQPAVIGEILAGVLLGPTFAGGSVTSALFPAQVQPSLTLLSNGGVCVFMFFLGLHLDRELLRGQGKIVGAVSVCSIALPFGLGVLLALDLADAHATGSRLAFALFLGTAMSITAFPVLARILHNHKLVRTPIGGLALACAAVDDVLAWVILAGVAAIANSGDVLWRLALMVPFAILVLTVVRPALARLARSDKATGRPVAAIAVVGAAAGITVCSMATDWMGLHPIFGAFLFGVAMPRGGMTSVRTTLLPRIEGITSVVLVPVFFLTAGLHVDLSGVGERQLGELALILVVAIGGKGVGAYAGARMCGVRPRHSGVLATLMNARGLTELVVLTVGLKFGVIDDELYSLMVVMALVTTAMTGLLLQWLYPAALVRRDTVAAAPIHIAGEGLAA